MLSTTWIGTIDRQTISNLTGTLSFVIWLFAQSPQLLENYRRGSVDGLSAVFLTQWMLGDATNLIGCVLTQQLPFQIAVATYFCCIDVCLSAQFLYYWSKARKERRRHKRIASANPYAVLSETSELLGGRASRHASFLRSSSRRRNLSHSQQLTHPLAASITHASTTDKSRSRSRHARPPPLSRSGSTDTVSAPGSASVANYRALSEAALSVAQLAQEAARRREAMLHHVHLADEDYFSHRRPRRSKSRASSSPFNSQPPSRSRSRVNSNDLGLPEDVVALAQSTMVSEEKHRRSRVARSMSSRRKGAAGNVDFVPSALSPTRESAAMLAEESEETEPESSSEVEAGSDAAAAMGDSIASLASVSTESSTASLQPRGRDMVRTATRIESGPASTSTPSEHSSSDGTARLASPKPEARERMSMSHHQLGQHNDEGGEAALVLTHEVKRAKKRRANGSTRSSSPIVAMYRSVDALTTAEGGKSGSKKRTLTRTSSSKSHSKRLATGALVPLTSSTTSATGGSSSNKRKGTKSPASLRRSIGMVLLGIMLITSLPDTPTVSAASISNLPPSHSLHALSLFDEGPSASFQRLVGRISAWLCALLYITSRIPQIWENHIRRSVAGLSILLFIAAFTGNLLYTISVLTNPSAVGEGKRAYLQESLPFLLGSGGTLVFDLIIVAQWLAWRKNGVSLE